MKYKFQAEERCPGCGRMYTSRRIHRSRIMRRFFPDAKQMKCFRCQESYLVRNVAEQAGQDINDEP